MIGPTTRALPGELFESSLGPVAVKGLAAPVQACRVLRPSAFESRSEALHAAALTPLIGRDEEINLLLRRWAQAKHGRGK